MIQTIDQLKAVFGDGKFPTLTNWEDLIDTIFAQNQRNIYSFHQSCYATGVPAMITPSANSVVGNVYNDNTFNPDDVVPVGTFMSSKFNIKTYKYTMWDNQQRTGYEPFILIIHNNGVTYGGGNHNTSMYVSWTANAEGEAFSQSEASREPRYFEYKNGDYVAKPQVAVIPLGCSVAFSYTELSRFQPIGNFTSIDYDTLIQQNNN